jgi:hypothetical protein
MPPIQGENRGSRPSGVQFLCVASCADECALDLAAIMITSNPSSSYSMKSECSHRHNILLWSQYVKGRLTDRALGN